MNNWTPKLRLGLSDAPEREIALLQDELVNKEGLKHSKILIHPLFLNPHHLPVGTGDKKMGKKLE